MVSTGFLAQASTPRLGETNNPSFLLELSLKRRVSVLSEMQSCSGNEGLPKREIAESHCSPFRALA
ncbi:hypothetical protein DEO72_LG5g717 [Vigna unguiculata]|uniref:Uncharacterized protein n=1 Tax=Vigna unguiculata TaxID=3917 RepID=A0A4D6LWA8_VIGUN|nr:hypothetical protein DEO72_LG5g716 [Vigna unguiculata]QCD92649.1 hypothetical protein DEO72_LG5g717 [Vigna unguiculata]